MPCFVAQNAHTLGVRTTFHFQHLPALEFHQTRMGQVERYCDAGNAVWREPLLGQPNVRFEANASSVEFPVEAFDVRLEKRVLDLDRQIANPQVEQLFVSKIVPWKPVAQTVRASLVARFPESRESAVLDKFAVSEITQGPGKTGILVRVKRQITIPDSWSAAIVTAFRGMCQRA